MFWGNAALQQYAYRVVSQILRALETKCHVENVFILLNSAFNLAVAIFLQSSCCVRSNCCGKKCQSA